MNLNPIFNEKENTKKTQINQRKTRSDKIHDMKFPVTDKQKIILRKKAKLDDVSVTKNNTQLLKNALKYPINYIPDYPYQDTKQYMHVKPTELEYTIISNLAIEWGISERKALYRLMCFILEKGEGL